MCRILLATILATQVFTGDVFSQSVDEVKKNRVIVMGMIHGGHKTSQRYGLEEVRRLIREIKPDAVFCEIPPDRIEEAKRQFKSTGEITEPRVKVFPEYVDVLFPLTKEMGFEMYPCAGWTKEMADARRKKMQELRVNQAGNYGEMEAAQKKLELEVEEQGGRDNPAFIHTQKYDALVKTGLIPYDKHFNDVLGPGGWTNINKSHYGLVEQNLDKLKNEGVTILIMFGAWHKYWFMEQLRQRDDIELVNLNKYLPTAKSDGASKSSDAKSK